MADTAHALRRPASLDEFLSWEQAQSDKHEFRGGRIRMMTGGTRRNAHIALNIGAALRAKLGAGPCRAYLSDVAVALREVDAAYYPDVVVDCGPYEGASRIAGRPTIVFEVLSPSTRDTDFSEKVPDYRDTETIEQIVLVEPDERRVHTWIKSNGRWRQAEFDAQKPELPLPSLGTSLTFDEIYAVS